MSQVTPPDQVKIRQATVADAEALRALRLEALQRHPEAFGSDYEREIVRPGSFWIERLAQPHGAVFVAAAATDLIGMTGVYRSELVKMKHNATVWGVYVRSGWRGRQVAVDLLSAAVNWAEQRSLKSVKLAVVTSNGSAIRAYIKSGFQVYGLDPAVIHYAGVYHDELLMGPCLTTV
jgi:ribosomal protein S18 acetylase RimI-like enzyme